MGYDIFLAHASVDKKVSEQLYDALTARGVNVFFDARCVPLGARWDQVIPKAQRDARITVVLISGAFDQAWYLSDEVATAIAAVRDVNHTHTVITVFLEGIPSDPFAIPYGLRVVQGLDLPRSGGIEAVADSLRDAVALHRKRPPAPTPATPATPPPARCDRGALHTRLCKLLDAQFETMILYAGLDRTVIAGRNAALTTRALDVVDLVTQGGEPVCTRVCDAIARVAPGLA